MNLNGERDGMVGRIVSDVVFGLTLSALLVSGQVMMCPYNHARAFLQELEYTIVPILYRSRNKRRFVAVCYNLLYHRTYTDDIY